MSYAKIVLFVGKKQSGKTTAAKFLHKHIATHSKWLEIIPYSFADSLKRFCIESGWIDYIQAYGKDEDKNSLSKLYWNTLTGNDGLMTAREVLQYIGTDLFRHIDPNIWINKCLYQIGHDGGESNALDFAIIDDGRFPNEVEKIKENDGIIIYLTRAVCTDSHSSENDLTKIDRSNFNYIIDNQDFTEKQLEIEIEKIAKEIISND